MSKTLVLASTGNVGSALVSALASAGHPVLAASRNPGRQQPQTNVEHVYLDYSDPATFAPNLSDADRVFLLAPPGDMEPHRRMVPFLAQATSGPRKIVLMTAGGVEHNSSAPLYAVEQALIQSGAPYVILRPNWFMDNFHTSWLEPIRQAGVLPVPAADSRSAFIDARDIAASAASALFDSRFDRKAFTLTGPESLTYTEAAATLSAASGRPIRYQPMDDEPFIQSLIAAGVPQDYARFLAQLFGFVRQGYYAQTSTGVQELTGQAPRTLAVYAQDHAAAWK